MNSPSILHVGFISMFLFLLFVPPYFICYYWMGISPSKLIRKGFLFFVPVAHIVFLNCWGFFTFAILASTSCFLRITIVCGIIQRLFWIISLGFWSDCQFVNFYIIIKFASFFEYTFLSIFLDAEKFIMNLFYILGTIYMFVHRLFWVFQTSLVKIHISWSRWSMDVCISITDRYLWSLISIWFF